MNGYGQDGAGPTESGSPGYGSTDKLGEQLAERRVLFMGPPGSGKTSILSVVFEDTVAYDTLGMMPTQQQAAYQMVAGITIYDFPGIDYYSETQYNPPNPAIYEGDYTSLVFVIDSQGDFQNSLATLFSVIRTAQAVNPQLPINIFINKVDSLSEELKQDVHQDMQQQVWKTMRYENLNSAYVQFFLTTIFHDDIREALSRVVQRLVPNHSSLETILNSFCSKSSLDKVFLFDVTTKIYLAMDSSPTDPQIFRFAFETLKAMDDVSQLCIEYLPPSDDGMMSQKVTFDLEGSIRVFVYQVNSYLSLLCVGSTQVIRQKSLLEFNGSKVAKAIRQILPS
ncbi:GTP-binding protein gtr2 [Coemansia spiralis]|uniref:GTP-binding protein n=2 Tax=Coemansia TaxID=4863 RepID=A0A9W8G639_9FUNG|nr:Gtr1/RagA G protein conserved region-domain-containing protein [Coemansia spiralis]KAJ1990619.1 GTP-binding protein gtr2 [Coemansia umbellata]KAJ2622404.1 GTP-binding protein gtr2 [Coemansia sp. RSA 1358]KAJ2675071.1 GTP-binding protein gtr2 [Coemansia spiralis]